MEINIDYIDLQMMYNSQKPLLVSLIIECLDRPKVCDLTDLHTLVILA